MMPQREVPPRRRLLPAVTPPSVAFVPVHFRTCHLCEAMCGVAVQYEGQNISEIRGDTEDPFSRGHICPKALALKDIHEDPDRLKTPLRRTPRGDFEDISWEQAFDEVTVKIREVQARHGRHSFAAYLGNPTVHSHGALLYAPFMLFALGSRNVFSATSLDQLPHMLAAFQMFGHQLLMPIPDLDRTDFLVVMGANPAVSNGSIMTAGDVKRRLASIRARGGKVWTIDPRRTETAQKADRHLFIRPGSDAFLLLGVLQHLLTTCGPRLGPLASFTEDVETLTPLVAEFTPERVASRTGISANVIRELAQTFAEAPRAAWYGRVGTCTQEFGGLVSWLINAVNIVTGRLDQPGGVLFPKPAVDLPTIADRLDRRGSFGRFHSRVRGAPEFSGELPTATLYEEIETPGEGQIRGLITIAGNPALSTPNGARLGRALADLELMVSIDLYVNETTRHAHYILPSTFGLERSHYDVAFHSLAVRNTAKWSPALFERDPRARHDWEILAELTRRLSRTSKKMRWSRYLQSTLSAQLGPDRLIDLLLRLGPYPLTRRRLAQSVHGIDLGPLTSSLPGRLCTPDKRIHLVPEIYRNDLTRLRQKLDSASALDSLSLIGRRDLRSNNSWMHNNHRFVKGRLRCTLQMHPKDAASRGLGDGDRVRMQSAAGSVEVVLQVTDEIMTGVVSMPHGWGHDVSGIRLSVARAHPGSSVNDVTDATSTDELTGTARFSDVPVTVEAV